jgi:hypothetical protein
MQKWDNWVKELRINNIDCVVGDEIRYLAINNPLIF